MVVAGVTCHTQNGMIDIEPNLARCILGSNHTEKTAAGQRFVNIQGYLHP